MERSVIRLGVHMLVQIGLHGVAKCWATTGAIVTAGGAVSARRQRMLGG
jgi:hypothetical protein